MTSFPDADETFFTDGSADKKNTLNLLKKVAAGCDDADVYFQQGTHEHCTLDDGRIKSVGLSTEKGFGLRVVQGDTFAYAHSNDISEKSLKKAAENISPVRSMPSGGAWNFSIPAENTPLYAPTNPTDGIEFSKKTALMQEIDAYVRQKDPRVIQVSASLSASFNIIKIMRPDGFEAQDFRPLVHLRISVVLQQNGRRESGSFGFGGRYGYEKIFSPNDWKHAANEALRQADVNLHAADAPVGEMPVVLGAGWCGVLLHEAVGHGLEGDFNRKKTSVFSDKMNEKVAASGVTVIDDGTLANRRGSLTIDDEGTPTQATVLIENGILKNYMQDRMNARLMHMNPTGNARRESFSCPPLVRMTNTFMQNGTDSFDDMIKSVKNGVYAASFSGGQVDIVSGNFVFGTSEAYKIENGKITTPVKNAMLIGSGTDVMNGIDMVGTDSCLDNGVGMCGKEGQSVPVGVGQPSVRIRRITVGGSESA